MENKDLQRHLFNCVKTVADSNGFDLHSFTVDEDLVDVSWRGFDTQGNLVELTHAFDLQRMSLARTPKAAIEGDVFICEKTIKEAVK